MNKSGNTTDQDLTRVCVELSAVIFCHIDAFIFYVSDYADRPLKLVLKVAGNEVTTGSAILEPVHDDLVDSDKHKDKKKKKKKKDEKDKESPPGSPGEDRKRKVRKCGWSLCDLLCGVTVAALHM